MGDSAADPGPDRPISVRVRPARRQKSHVSWPAEAGHPRLCWWQLQKSWVAGPSPAMTHGSLFPRVGMTRKLVVYFRLPSVQHHLVFWADRRQVIHHRRRDDGQGIDTRMMTEGEIVLDPPGIAIAVEDVYAD